MKQIVDHVFLGDSSDARDFLQRDYFTSAWTNPGNITGVINCSGFDPRAGKPQVENYYAPEARARLGIPFDIEYYWLNLTENSPIDRGTAERVVDFIDGHLARGGNVLVHCVAGLQRSPSIILAYLLSKGTPLMDGLHVIEGKKGGNIYPTMPMLRSIAKLHLDGRRVMDKDIARFTRMYRQS
jgi:hypothetical protein